MAKKINMLKEAIEDRKQRTKQLNSMKVLLERLTAQIDQKNTQINDIVTHRDLTSDAIKEFGSVGEYIQKNHSVIIPPLDGDDQAYGTIDLTILERDDDVSQRLEYCMRLNNDDDYSYILTSQLRALRDALNKMDLTGK